MLMGRAVVLYTKSDIPRKPLASNPLAWLREPPPLSPGRWDPGCKAMPGLSQKCCRKTAGTSQSRGGLHSETRKEGPGACTRYHRHKAGLAATDGKNRPQDYRRQEPCEIPRSRCGYFRTVCLASVGLLVACLPHSRLLIPDGPTSFAGDNFPSSCRVHKFVLTLPGCKVLMFARLPSHDVFVVHAILPNHVLVRNIPYRA